MNYYHPISIAPMMACTDRHDRFFLRLIAPHVLLYTEMITTGALIFGDYEQLLLFNEREHPISLQLGGSDPKQLAQCAILGASAGYDEINLNVGCPSERVKNGRFGACLMLEPNLVAECIAAMSESVMIPVTIKCRIGVDQSDSYDFLTHFIEKTSKAGCCVYILHARKAWLHGLSPKQNRTIPPLQYETVYQIKKDFPQLKIIINGGIQTTDQIDQHLLHVDGVMIGREAYSNPYFLAEIEKKYYSTEADILTRDAVIEQFIPYVEDALRNNIKLSSITRHILGLFYEQKGARIWRRHLSEHAHKEGANIIVIKEALQYVRDAFENS